MKKTKKSEMCEELISQGKVKLYDVIRHNYTNTQMNGNLKESPNNICPTLDTRCDCLGVVVDEEDN